MNSEMMVYIAGQRRAWYDPHLRLWTLQTVDQACNQVGDCDYATRKGIAIKWLSGCNKNEKKEE